MAQGKHIAPSLAIPIAAAFLIELTFLAAIKRMVTLRPSAWISSALIPYFVLTVPTGLFQWWHAILLGALAYVICRWLSYLDPKWDLVFLGLLTFLLLVPGLYPEVLNLKVPTLGKLMWFRLGVTSVLAFRDHGQLNFGFWPTPREWQVGVQTLFLIIPVAIALNAIFPVVNFRVVSDTGGRLRAISLDSCG